MAALNLAAGDGDAGQERDLKKTMTLFRSAVCATPRIMIVPSYNVCNEVVALFLYAHYSRTGQLRDNRVQWEVGFRLPLSKCLD